MHDEVIRIREMYPTGTRIELIHMDDPYAPVPGGTKGTVAFVDDAAQIHMRWDNGRSLALVPGVDAFRKIEEQAEDINGDEDVFPTIKL